MRGTGLLGLLAVGCVPGSTGVSATDDGPGPAVRDCPSALAVQAGTGEDGFVALEPLDTVTMVHGPQGGWHVDTSGLVTGSTGQVSAAPRLVLRDSGETIAGDQQPQYLALVDYRDAECDGTFYGVRAFLDDQMEARDTATTPQEVICGYAGRIAELTVDVGDLTTEETTSAAVEVTLELDPRDLDACAGG